MLVLFFLSYLVSIFDEILKRRDHLRLTAIEACRSWSTGGKLPKDMAEKVKPFLHSEN